MNIQLDWKALAEALGAIAIVMSLVFVGLQIQQTHSIAVSEILAANTGHRIEANAAIIENSDVWDKANSGGVLTTEEVLIVERLIDNVTAERISLYHHYWELGDDGAAEGALMEFADFFSRYPGVFKIWLRAQRNTNEAIVILTGETPQRAQLVEIMQVRVEKILTRREAERPGEMSIE